jgi:hypothetical protein
MKILSLLFCLCLRKNYAFYPFQHKNKNIPTYKLEYREDDWDHGEVEWDFPDKYIIFDKLKYTSLINTPIINNIQNFSTHINNKLIISESNDDTHNALYYGIMETINDEAINFQEILLNIQNICFVKTDSNEDVSKDFYILLLIYSLKTNYELSKNRENVLLNKIHDKKKYIKIKRIVSSIILIIFTILCRNVNIAE